MDLIGRQQQLEAQSGTWMDYCNSVLYCIVCYRDDRSKARLSAWLSQVSGRGSNYGIDWCWWRNIATRLKQTGTSQIHCWNNRFLELPRKRVSAKIQPGNLALRYLPTLLVAGNEVQDADVDNFFDVDHIQVHLGTERLQRCNFSCQHSNVFQVSNERFRKTIS